MSRKRKSFDSNGTRIIPAPKLEYRWTDRELLNLTAALQCYGFSEIKKIAEKVGTKDESSVKFYLESEIGKLNNKFSGKRSLKHNENHAWFHPHSSELKNWPSVRKWKRLMYNQLFKEVKIKDYSKIVMEDLLQAFYEEAEESSDPQVINIKAVYKYLLDTVRGYVPAELPPIDSGIVLLLLGQLKEMQRDLDFDEEIDFLKSFKKARQFKPLKIKEEFQKARKSSETEKNESETSQPKNNTELKVEQSTAESSDPKNKESVTEQDAPEPSDTKKFIKKIEQNLPESSDQKNDLGADDSNCNYYDDDEAIEVDEEMYHYLTKHRKVVQSMNPLNIPLWTLIKEQGYVHNKCEISTRMSLPQNTCVKSQIQ